MPMNAPLQPAPEPVVGTIPELLEYAARQYGDAPFQLRWTPGGWEPLSFREAALQGLIPGVTKASW